MIVASLVVVSLLACGEETTASSCEDLCQELVNTCGYEAYPTFESCLQGCNYRVERGADITDELTCVQEAACDTFAVIECEHATASARADAEQ